MRLLLAGVLSLSFGCGGGGGGGQPDGAPPPGPDAPTGGPDASTPGDGITGALGRATGLRAPFDAIPSPDGTMLYYTALDVDGVGAVYRIGCGGGAATLVATGFAAPVGLTISTAGDTLFVADLGTDQDDDVGDPTKNGAIYSVAAAGGTPSELAGTRGYRPRGLDLVAQGGADVLYFTGTDPTSGAAGLFKRTGAVSAVATGAPFGEPSGVAVSASGDAYVADARDTMARIIKVSDGTATELVGGLRVGFPVGVALTRSETTLMVSGLNATTGMSQVSQIDLATMGMTAFDLGVATGAEAAGLHRAHNASKLAWSDGTGTVYEVATEADPLCP